MMLHCLFLLLSTIVGEWHGVFVLIWGNCTQTCCLETFLLKLKLIQL
uniref:Uncharacterized protein n=1 Tax=Anguilla anguilla TaxID=7936 RepID=A0A0E9V7P5_ANGAN